MASVTILRLLWRNRVAVGVVGILAILAGWMVAFGPAFPPTSRAYTVGIASASVLIDTPKSQVVEVEPRGSDTLAERANVLASLMVDGDIKDAIAARAGVAPKKLVATMDVGDGSAPTPPLTRDSLAYTTSVAVTSDMAQLPIVRVSTQAPDVRRAIMLADAAMAGLGDYLDAKAGDETIPDRRRLRVRAVGAAQGHAASRGPGKTTVLGTVLVVFMLGCGIILAASALSRSWHAAAAAEADAGLAGLDVLGDDATFAEDGTAVHPLTWEPDVDDAVAEAELPRAERATRLSA